MKVKLVAFEKLEAYIDIPELKPEIRLAHMPKLVAFETEGSPISSPGPIAGVFELDHRRTKSGIPIYKFTGMK